MARPTDTPTTVRSAMPMIREDAQQSRRPPQVPHPASVVAASATISTRGVQTGLHPRACLPNGGL